ncbi:MAG: hypothetical protein R2764_10280 [Bacteroidales bacterium]
MRFASEGFRTPALGMNYNPPYYVDLFEAYGFKPFLSRNRSIWMSGNPFLNASGKLPNGLSVSLDTFEHIRKTQFEKFTKDIVEIHNAAWVHHEHFHHSPSKRFEVHLKKQITCLLKELFGCLSP